MNKKFDSVMPKKVSIIVFLVVTFVFTLFSEAEIIWREDFENKDQVFGRWREEKLDRKKREMVQATGVLSLSQSRKVSGRQCARLDMDKLRKSGNKRNFRIVITTDLPPNKGGVLTVWMYDYNESYAYYAGVSLNDGDPPNKRPQISLYAAGISPNFRFMGRKFKSSELSDIPRKTGWRKLQFVLDHKKTKGKIRAYVDGRFAGETNETFQKFQELSVGAAVGMLRFWPLFFDNITLDDDPDAIEKDLFKGVDLVLKTDRIGNVFNEGEELKVEVMVKNRAGEDKKFLVSGILCDENGTELSKANDALILVPAGAEEKSSLKFPASPRKGPLFATISAEADGQILSKAEIGLGVIADPQKIKKDLSSIIGSHFRVCQMDQYIDPGYISHRLLDIRNNPVSWAGMEPKKGEFKWETTDSYVNELRDLHKYPEIMYTLHSCPEWAVDPELKKKARVIYHALPGDMEDWRNYVEKMAERYKGKVQAWEIWNEVNTPYHLTGSYKNYFELLKTAYEAIKKVDPEAKVVGITCSGVDLRFIEEIFKLGGLKYLDILGMHPYPHGAPEERVLGKIQAVRRLMASYGGIKPIWDTEYGFYTTGVNDRNRPKDSREIQEDRAKGFITLPQMGSDVDVANWAARLAILYAANGVERLFYHFHPMVHGNGMAKYFTYSLAAAVRELSGAEFIRKIDLGDENLHAYLFQKGDEYFAALWAVEGRESVALILDAPKYQLMDIWGNIDPKSASNKVAELLLTEKPVFIKNIGPNLAPASKSLSIQIPPPSENAVFSVKITTRNKKNEPLAGSISLKAPGKWKIEPHTMKIEIPAKSNKETVFTLTAAPGVYKGNWPLRAEFKSENGEITWLDDAKIATLIPMNCPRLKKTVQLDGELSEWPDWSTAPTIKEEKQVKIGLPLIDHVIHDSAVAAGETFWEGPDDVSVVFQTAWDEDFLYVAAKVRDDTVRNQHPKGPWMGDSLEVFIDGRKFSDRKANREQIKVFQLIFAPEFNGNKTPSVKICRNGALDFKNMTPKDFKRTSLPLDLGKVEVASKITKDGYTMEMKVPFSIFDFQKPKSGETFGFDLAVDDQDQLDKKRESQSFWMGDKDNCGDPNLFGTIKLTDK